MDVITALISLCLLILFSYGLVAYGNHRESKRKSLAQKVLKDVEKELKLDERQKKKLESIKRRYRLRTTKSDDRSNGKDETSTGK